MLTSKLFTFLLSLFMLGFTSCFAENNQSVKGSKPNIVFILADDLGWADLPCYGNTFNEAPNLDKLANSGIRFMNAYAACPVCSPTRASIQSGQYPARVGVIDFITGHWRPFEEFIVPKNRTQYLPGEIVTLAESLKKAGYKTGYFGKWHLGRSPETVPETQGYDKVHVYSGGGFYNSKFKPQPKKEYKGRLSKILTDMGVEFIEENKDKPFFLFLAHYDVHVQLDADKNLIEKYLKKKRKDEYPGNAVYAAMVEHVDNSVGRVVKKLKELVLEENTIVIFNSDNGGLISRFDKIPLLADNSLSVYENSPLKYIATSNAPLRAEKGTVYEGGIREPLIVKWPSKIKAGKICEALVSSVDFYPTFLELAGVEKPNQVLDGKSILPELIENKYDYERAIYWHYPVYHHEVPMGAIRKGDWKLVENFATGKMSLYNLRADISEAVDLSKLYPEKTSELTQLIHSWQKDVKAKFPIPNPNFDESRRFEWGIHPDRK
ncbi:MAG: sulfatase [Draconibacterium sp.]|nr:sulfatase [Draconibacterium sp.]